MVNYIRLSYPDLEFKEVAQSLKEVIDSGWLTKGPKTAEFEDMARRYFKTKHAIAVSSGTAALHLSLLSLGIKTGDEVIVPDFTFPATANAVELCGAKAVLVDIDPVTLNFDLERMRKKINRKTRAIIPVHQFGNPVNMDEILEIAKRCKLYVIEDAACAVGAKHRSTMCGTIGDIGCFSFHPRKIISTGEGGLIVTDNSRLAETCRRLREHGMKIVGRNRIFKDIGLNYRISEIASVLGISQLKKVERIIKKRIHLAEQFKGILKSIKEVAVFPPGVTSGNRCVYQSFVVIIDRDMNILTLVSFLKKRGIEASISNIVLSLQPYYAKKYHLKKSDFKNSLWVSGHSLALPFHSRMMKQDFTYIASVLKKYFKK